MYIQLTVVVKCWMLYFRQEGKDNIDTDKETKSKKKEIQGEMKIQKFHLFLQKIRSTLVLSLQFRFCLQVLESCRLKGDLWEGIGIATADGVGYLILSLVLHPIEFFCIRFPASRYSKATYWLFLKENLQMQLLQAFSWYWFLKVIQKFYLLLATTTTSWPFLSKKILKTQVHIRMHIYFLWSRAVLYLFYSQCSHVCGSLCPCLLVHSCSFNPILERKVPNNIYYCTITLIKGYTHSCSLTEVWGWRYWNWSKMKEKTENSQERYNISFNSLEKRWNPALKLSFTLHKVTSTGLSCFIFADRKNPLLDKFCFRRRNIED